MNVYGPRQDYRGAYIAVIMKMLDAIDRGERPDGLGDGSRGVRLRRRRGLRPRQRLRDEGRRRSTASTTSAPARGPRSRSWPSCCSSSPAATSAIQLRAAQASDVRAQPHRRRRRGAHAEIGFTRAGRPAREGCARLIAWRAAHKAEVERAARGRRVGSDDRPTRTHPDRRCRRTGDEEWQALREPLETGWLTQGPKVAAFEKAFAARHGVGHALAVDSAARPGCTWRCAALGIGPGDEVIVPAFTWVATANVVALLRRDAGLRRRRPRRRYNIDPADLRAARHAAHAGGHPGAPVRPVRRHGRDPRRGAARRARSSRTPRARPAPRYEGVPAGGLGDAGVLLLPPAQVDHDRRGRDGDDQRRRARRRARAAAQPRRLGLRGAAPRGPRPYLLPDFDLLGFNYRMTDLQGAVGLVQLAQARPLHRRARSAGRRITATSSPSSTGCARPMSRTPAATPGRPS